MMPSLQEVHPAERRVALRHCGRVDPQDVESYSAAGGFAGLKRALQSDPQEVISRLGAAGVRERGRGRDLAARWRETGSVDAEEKYAVCNAIDADPVACTARLLLGADPYSVLEGLLIVAHAVGATQAVVCLTAGCGEEAATVGGAAEAMRKRGLLGDHILGSGFSCEIAVQEVPGVLVAGEETALLQVLTGRQPLPYLPRKSTRVAGLRGSPTVLELAETLSVVAAALGEDPVVAAGGDEGTPGDSSGGGRGREGGNDGIAAGEADPHRGGRGGVVTDTKVVTVSGPGEARTVEVPLGTSLAAVISAAGLGTAAAEAKVVRLGGPAGRFVPSDGLDLPLTYEHLAWAGSTMGSASVEVFPGDLCPVTLARDAMAYLNEQSCGKCVACREGTYQLLDLLDDIAGCRATAEDLELMLDLGGFITSNSICEVGRNAFGAVASTFELFASEYHCHVDGKRCSAEET